MFFSDKKINKVKVGIIGVGNRGSVLLEMFQYLVENNHAEIISYSPDISEKKVNNALDKLSKFQNKKLNYFLNLWMIGKKMCKIEDIDLILISYSLEFTCSYVNTCNGNGKTCCL